MYDCLGRGSELPPGTSQRFWHFQVGCAICGLGFAFMKGKLSKLKLDTFPREHILRFSPAKKKENVGIIMEASF